MPASLASRGEVVDGMEMLWHTPHATIPVACFAEMVAATETHPAVVVLSIFDTSRATRLEQELSTALNARDDFLTLAAHELRTPMTALKLEIDTQRKRFPDAGGLAAVERATARMNCRVEQIVEAARICATGVQIQPEELDLCVVVDRVLNRFRDEAARVGSSLDCSGDANVRGRWDRVGIDQLVTQLVCNALRFGAGKPVRVECRNEGEGHASLAVSDAGIGIAPADQALIFERFARVGSARTAAGLGLGLWIVRETVSAMGGTIGVSSALDAGATFTVRLPKTHAQRGASSSASGALVVET